MTTNDGGGSFRRSIRLKNGTFYDTSAARNSKCQGLGQCGGATLEQACLSYTHQ